MIDVLYTRQELVVSFTFRHSDKDAQFLDGCMQLTAGVCERKREYDRTGDILGVIYLTDVDSLHLGKQVFAVAIIASFP